MENYNLPKAMRPITEFIDEFSTWYLRRSRDRFKSDDKNDKNSALVTTRFVLLELSKIMAPFLPFISESLWQKVSGYNFKDENKSVHLESYPKISGMSKEQDEILKKMISIRNAIRMGLSARDKAKIKVRQALSELFIDVSGITFEDGDQIEKELLKLIKDEVNVCKVSKIADQGERKKSRSREDDFSDYKEDNGDYVSLFLVITPELKMEGIKRELIRFINMLRKDANLSLGDEAAVYLICEEAELREVVLKMEEDIKRDTLSQSISFTEKMPEILISKSVKVNELALQIGLKK